MLSVSLISQFQEPLCSIWNIHAERRAVFTIAPIGKNSLLDHVPVLENAMRFVEMPRRE